MRERPEILLDVVKQSPKLNEGRIFQASDFMTKDEATELRVNNARGRKKRPFDSVDAYVAEIIARFGYHAYLDWNKGAIPDKTMAKLIAAERAREKGQLLELEGIIIAMVGDCIRREKGQPRPKGPKTARKIFKRVAKAARGEL